MEIIETETGSEFPFSWPFSSFQNAYRDILEKGTLKHLILVEAKESGEADKTAMAIVRLFIENPQKESQKYIMAMRFYSFGDMITFDIISLNKNYHREMVNEHARRMNWEGEDSFGNLSSLNKSFHLPIFIMGGHLSTKNKNVIFFDSSGDFGNNFLGTDTNDVAKQLAFLCGIGKEKSNEGNKALKKLLRFTLDNKMKEDFYERFAELYINKKMTAQNLGSLVIMKVLDRKIREPHKNPLEILVEETTEGFARNYVILGVANKLNHKKE